MYIMAPEPFSTAYFVNPTISLRVFMCTPPVVASQGPGKNVTAATNTHVAIEELFDSSLSIRSVSLQRKASDCFFPEFVMLSFNASLKTKLFPRFHI
jgi:hypothetical protein